MGGDIGRSQHRRFSIGAVMLWIAAIALVCASFRSQEILLSLGPLVALVLASSLTYGLLRKVDGELIASRA